MIIFDSGESNKWPIYDYWSELNLVDICRKGEEKDFPILAKAFEVEEDKAETQEQWRALGIKLFRKKFYESVIKCFEKSGDTDLIIRTYAYQNAEEASALMSEGETCTYVARHNLSMSKRERNDKKREGKQLKSQAIVKFGVAAENFEKINVYQRAAQCYYTCKYYEKAGELFEKAEMFQQAAECLMVTGNFSKAAKMFEESKLYLKSFE